jgi:hypothetical protein
MRQYRAAHCRKEPEVKTAEPAPVFPQKKNRAVIGRDLNGKETEYSNVKEAVKAADLRQSTMYPVIRTGTMVGGCRWRYKDA